MSQVNCIKIGPALPNSGGLFLEFPTFDLAIVVTSALEKLSSCPKIILLPTIHVSTHPPHTRTHTHTHAHLQPDVVGYDQEPILVFINGKSGGNQGVKLIPGFRSRLNPHQVYDLMNGGPLPGLVELVATTNFCLQHLFVVIGIIYTCLFVVCLRNLY